MPFNFDSVPSEDPFGLQIESPMMNEEYVNILSAYRDNVQRKALELQPIKFRNDDEKDKVAREVFDKYRYSANMLLEKHTSWQDVREAYQGEKEFEVIEKVAVPKSNVHVPLMTNHIDTAVSNITVRMLEPYYNFIQARDLKTYQRKYSLENYLFTVWKQGKYPLEIMKAIRESIMYSFGIIKLIPDHNLGIPIPVAVSQFNFFPDVYARDKDDCTYVIERTWESIETIQQKADSGYYDPTQVKRLLKYLKALKTDDDGKNDLPKNLKDVIPLMAEEVTDVFDEPSVDDVDKFNRIEILEYHDGSRTFIVAYDQYLLRSVVNPFGLPYFFFYSRVPDTSNIYIKSIGEMMLPLQNEIDVKRNQRIDNINKMIDNPLLVDKTAARSLDDIVINESNHILVNDIKGISPLPIPDATNKAFEEEQAIRSDAADLSAVTNAISGKPIKAQRMTKEEFGSTFGQATLKFDAVASVVILTGLIPLLHGILKMCGLMSTNIAETPADQGGTGSLIRLLPTDLLGQYEINVNINPNQIEIDRQNSMSLYQLFVQDPMMDPILLRQHLVPKLAPDFPLNAIMRQPMPTMAQEQIIPKNIQLSKNDTLK